MRRALIRARPVLFLPRFAEYGGDFRRHVVTLFYQKRIAERNLSMTRTLQKHGNSQALVIEKPLMEATGITMDTPLEITVSGDAITIRRANVGFGRETVASLLKELRTEYTPMLENLAK